MAEIIQPSYQGGLQMKLSARSQFTGTVTHITQGQAMAEVTVKVGNLEVVAAITEGSVKSMGLKVNDSVTVAVKATDVMVGK
jgi:molybdopterin-binding protein